MARASALEEMASGITHELNQPLGAIVTYAQAGERLLNRPEATLDNAREVLKLISQEALAAAAGVRRVRKPFQRDGLDKSPCAMSEVVRELGTLIEPRAAAAQVSLQFDLETALPTVDIHRRRVQHVLFTLALNAIEAALAGHSSPPHVTITVSGDRYGVETAVLDNGGGIADEHRGQIFRPFFTTKPHGTGLGLAGARAIVEWHGGTIGFQPQGSGGNQQGSRFWFRLPASCGLI
jgi:C4-dicarboxylate-specific signal transduction histidine kinase